MSTGERRLCPGVMGSEDQYLNILVQFSHSSTECNLQTLTEKETCLKDCYEKCSLYLCYIKLFSIYYCLLLSCSHICHPTYKGNFHLGPFTPTAPSHHELNCSHLLISTNHLNIYRSQTHTLCHIVCQHSSTHLWFDSLLRS